MTRFNPPPEHVSAPLDRIMRELAEKMGKPDPGVQRLLTAMSDLLKAHRSVAMLLDDTCDKDAAEYVRARQELEKGATHTYAARRAIKELRS